MTPTKLFCHRIAALDRIVAQRGEEDLLELSGILRQLLIDSHPLIDVVNRDFRLRLRFDVGQSYEESREDHLRRVPTLPEPSIAYISVMPFPGDSVKSLTKDQFLAYKIFFLKPIDQEEGCTYSVKDFILMCANRLGGVHFSDPSSDDDKERSLRGANNFMSVYGSPVAFSNLAEIAVVTRNGIEPLINAVYEREST